MKLSCHESETIVSKWKRKMEQDKAIEGHLTRKDFPVYESNPSLESQFPMRIKPKRPQKIGNAYMLAPGSGKVTTVQGTFQFVEEKIVDTEEFVKIYVQGVKKWSELSKTGALLFELLYKEMSGKAGKDRDTVLLNHAVAVGWKPDLTRSTFYRGLNELLAKGFLFRTIGADLFFVNINFMYNGDRVRIVQDFQLRKMKEHKQLPILEQQSLPLTEKQ